jgi:hypothetical protein
MFITKKHLSRRTVLRGAGAAIALPLLDSMIPARTALAQTAAAPKTRLGCIYIPHGVTMDKWTPATTGKGFELTEILSPLAPVRDQICVISGLTHAPVAPWPGEDSGGANNHNRAGAVFLSGAHPVKGNRAVCGPSLDQLAAAHMGQDTPIPSSELALEQGGLNCDSGNTCAYINTLAWKSATLPLPMEHNPQVAFERLFGLGVTEAERAVRRTEASSVLDSVLGQSAKLQGALPASDRRVFSDYLEDVREVERRVVQVDSLMSSGVELPEPPVGVPDDLEEHANLMFDLQVLAYKTEITRISTFMYGRELSNTIFPNSGVRESWHLASHHSNDRKNMDQYAVLNRYHVGLLTSFLSKLRATPDGDGTLLDHSVILYGSSLSDGNQHNFSPLPILLAGGAAGQLEGGRHLAFPEGTPMSNLLLALLHKIGSPVDSIGDSTGPLEI